MSDRQTTDTTPWWLWPILAVINPLSMLWLYALAETVHEFGWNAAMEILKNAG